MTDTCSQCGLCCRMFLINLTEEEYRSGTYKTHLQKFGFIADFRKATGCGANILKHKEDGECIYLKENKCSVYNIRPSACREFFCTSKQKKFRTMIKQIDTFNLHKRGG
jgi:Fe-S-cluster containining protein